MNSKTRQWRGMSPRCHHNRRPPIDKDHQEADIGLRPPCRFCALNNDQPFVTALGDDDSPFATRHKWKLSPQIKNRQREPPHPDAVRLLTDLPDDACDQSFSLPSPPQTSAKGHPTTPSSRARSWRLHNPLIVHPQTVAQDADAPPREPHSTTAWPSFSSEKPPHAPCFHGSTQDNPRNAASASRLSQDHRDPCTPLPSRRSRSWPGHLRLRTTPSTKSIRPIAS